METKNIDIKWFLNDFKSLVEKLFGLTASEAGAGDDFPFLEIRTINLSIEIHEENIIAIRYNSGVKYFHQFSNIVLEEKIIPYLENIANKKNKITKIN